jgi:hypothetical protein
MAAQNGQVAMVKCLIERGCDVEAKSYLGKSFVELALESGHSEIVDFYFEGRVSNEIAEKLLFRATELGLTSLVAAILAKGVDANAEVSCENMMRMGSVWEISDSYACGGAVEARGTRACACGKWSGCGLARCSFSSEKVFRLSHAVFLECVEFLSV